MKTLITLGLTVGALLNANAHADLIETGAAFTGNYIVQERSCEKVEFSSLSGEQILEPHFNFQGTVDGLKVDVNLIPIKLSNPVNHGEGIQTDAYASYVSGKDFLDTFVVTDPLQNQGLKTITTDDYEVAQNGSFKEITKTTKVIVGSLAPTVKVCHYLGF